LNTFIAKPPKLLYLLPFSILIISQKTGVVKRFFSKEAAFAEKRAAIFRCKGREHARVSEGVFAGNIAKGVVFYNSFQPVAKVYKTFRAKPISIKI